MKSLFGFIALGLISSQAFSQDSYNWRKLSVHLEGFAKSTTGGNGGVIYTVKSNLDNGDDKSPLPGSLRHAIKMSDKTKPLWVNFELEASQRKILLKSPLRLRSNLTIDGRGSDGLGQGITIANVVDWSPYHLTQASKEVTVDGLKKTVFYRKECNKKPGLTVPSTALFIINRVSNIIVTSIRFDRDNFYGSPWEETDPDFDRQCLGDLISIAHDKVKSSNFVDNIWLHKNIFVKCGDGCIDVTRPDHKTSRLSFSYNVFADTDKTMILGGAADAYQTAIDPVTKGLIPNVPNGTYYYKASLYGNRFLRVNERNPRISSAVVHMYNNVFDSWKMYIVFAFQSKVLYEQNYHNNSLNRPIIAANADAVFCKDNQDFSGKRVDQCADAVNFDEQKSLFINYPYKLRPMP